MIFGWELAYREVWLSNDVEVDLVEANQNNSVSHDEEDLVGYPVKINGSKVLAVVSVVKLFNY